jgi:TolB protein
MTTKGHSALLIFLVCVIPGFADMPGLGLFSNQGNVGNVSQPGSALFDASKGTYLIAGSGDNMWFTNDAFHYVWKEMSGDVSLTADIRWQGTSDQPHRKACLIIRQNADADSPYADAVLHGNGLASLQYRETPGGLTREIQSNVSGPTRLRIEKRGSYVSMSIAPAGEKLRRAGGSFRIEFAEPFYVGLAVCAHNNQRLELAEFSNVEIARLSPARTVRPALESTLEVLTIASLDRRVVYHTSERIEAPNWSPDGQYFVLNNSGRLCQLPVTGGPLQRLDTGTAIHCNNDHGISPDGSELVISDQSGAENISRIHVLPVKGGTPRLVTPLGPSYWHGWSPDGKTLAYCGERKGEFDIYTIPVESGDEKRLTTASGLDDGPEYSPDGRTIYFCSDRTGLMQIWRMKPDGSQQEQVMSDEYNNWFPHPSPDGRWIAFLSYPKDVKGHPENKDVMLRLMPTRGGEIQVLAKLFGGQGTINVPSWSPDSRQIAFVSYQLVYP